MGNCIIPNSYLVRKLNISNRYTSLTCNEEQEIQIYALYMDINLTFSWIFFFFFFFFSYFCPRKLALSCPSLFSETFKQTTHFKMSFTEIFTHYAKR